MIKKNVKIIGALLTALLLVAFQTALAADASVTYEGGAEKFVFLPGSSLSDSDLFDNFKGVMPGDVLEQKITVKNATGKSVRIYMRADPVSELDRDFLSQLRMTVKSGSETIFQGTAGEQDGLTQNKLLGTFKKNGSTELTVTLTVPAELGNEYMDRTGTVPWVFLVEEIAEETTPETGDWFRLPVWIALALLLLAAVLILARRRERKA